MDVKGAYVFKFVAQRSEIACATIMIRNLVGWHLGGSPLVFNPLHAVNIKCTTKEAKIISTTKTFSKNGYNSLLKMYLQRVLQFACRVF